ncbi:MAG: hypothetical protein U0L72_06800 [Acutalibacteraceae bacterium]|nr:hypothetical protein [Acutalibacteraceae bacterium]
MSFKIFSTKVTVSFLFTAMVCVLLLCDRTGFAFPMLCSVVFHEAGHFLAMYVCGCAPTEVRLIPGSVQICSPSVCLKHEVFILVCGPLINLLLFSVLFVNCYIFSNISFLEFSIINLVYGVFNMLPLKGVDGGSILHIFLTRFFGFQKADRTLNIITLVGALFAFLGAFFLTANGTVNYSVYIMALYLILSVFLKF